MNITARATLILLLMASSLSLAFAQGKPNPLDRVTKATTIINYHATGNPPTGISEGRLRTLLELKLRSAGLRILSEEEDRADPAINPYIYLEVSTLETRNRGGNVIGWSYAVRISARVFAAVPINAARAPVELWSDSTMGVASQESASSETERTVTAITETFLNAWLAANPKR